MKLKLFFGFLFILVFSGMASGAPNSSTCSESPNPVQALPYPDPYNITINLLGGSANTSYYVWLSESHNNQITQQHPAGFLITDSTGNGNVAFDGNDPTHVLKPGTINVKITTYPSGARITTCSFQVI